MILKDNIGDTLHHRSKGKSQVMDLLIKSVLNLLSKVHVLEVTVATLSMIRVVKSCLREHVLTFSPKGSVKGDLNANFVTVQEKTNPG